MANLKLWSLRLLTFVTSVAFFATAPVYGATTQCQPGQLLKTGAVGTVVAVGPTGDCTDPLNPLPSVWSFWSNPNVFVNGNGVLTWSAQANRPVSASCSTEVGIDRWFSATYNPGTNAWTPPAASACADARSTSATAS